MLSHINQAMIDMNRRQDWMTAPVLIGFMNSHVS